MKATDNDGILKNIQDCYIKIFFSHTDPIIVLMNNLPDITDSKSANYPEENPIGRSSPFKSFRNSETRSISWTAHFFIQKKDDAINNLKYLRAIEAAVYTQKSSSTSYAPPPICKIKCGELLSKNELCVVLKSYNVRFDTTVPWCEINSSYLPYKFDVDMQFDIVYDNKDLPNAEKILTDFNSSFANSNN